MLLDATKPKETATVTDTTSHRPGFRIHHVWIVAFPMPKVHTIGPLLLLCCPIGGLCICRWLGGDSGDGTAERCAGEADRRRDAGADGPQGRPRSALLRDAARYQGKRDGAGVLTPHVPARAQVGTDSGRDPRVS